MRCGHNNKKWARRDLYLKGFTKTIFTWVALTFIDFKTGHQKLNHMKSRSLEFPFSFFTLLLNLDDTKAK